MRFQSVVPHTTRSGFTVSSGRDVYVSRGDTVVDTRVLGGGVEEIAGVASGTTLTGGDITSSLKTAGEQVVDSGGVTDDLTIGAGGAALVVAGGHASGVVVQSGGEFIAGAGSYATDITVERGGEIQIYNSAHVTDLTLEKGAREIRDFEVFDGTTLTGGTVSGGGYVLVDPGGLSDGLVVWKGGSLDVYSGGEATGVTIRTGGELVVDRGAQVDAYVRAGATVDFDDVLARNAASAGVVSGRLEVFNSAGAVLDRINVDGVTGGLKFTVSADDYGHAQVSVTSAGAGAAAIRQAAAAFDGAAPAASTSAHDLQSPHFDLAQAGALSHRPAR